MYINSTNSFVLVSLIPDFCLQSKRLIRPSRKLTQRYGAQHVEDILLERCVSITQQIVLQLKAKCALRNYLRSKKELENLHASLVDMQQEQSTRDFELV